LKFDSDGFPAQLVPSTDEIDVRGVIIDSGAGTGINMNGTKVTNLADGVNPGDGVNRGQLDSAVVTGGVLKELLLHQNQLNDTDGIYAAEGFYLAAQPATGDYVTLTDGTTTRTYEFGSLVTGDVQVTIGGTVAATMQNLATAITGDASGAWDAVFEADSLDEINADGVVVIYENTTAAGDSTSRIWGVFATPANAQVLEFASGGTVDTEYRGTTTVNMPGSDPAEGRFGMRRQQSALIDGEMHDNRSDNYLYKWDDTTDAWLSMTGPGSIPWATAGSGGGIKGIVSADSDKGLDITSGVMEVKVDDDGIQFVGGSIARKGVDKFTLTAGTGGVTKGDPVYISANDTGLPVDNSTANTKKFCGVSEDTVTATNPFQVQQEGVLAGVTVAGSPAAGDVVWCDTPSGLTVTLPTGSPRYRLKIGIMKNATDLIVEPQYMGAL
jgi:hypothetical protein